ncbi:protein scabrous [Culicoides brevitarsis]|uniref:protein scabrous n=1 Tax=Culicoides brevitarsis TaxID=469753 RepID=UPI00307B7290
MAKNMWKTITLIITFNILINIAITNSSPSSLPPNKSSIGINEVKIGHNSNDNSNHNNNNKILDDEVISNENDYSDNYSVAETDFDDDNDDDDDENDRDNGKTIAASQQSSSNDEQIKLLSKQLKALTERRQDDLKSLESNLRKYVRKNAVQILNEDLKRELEDLREEVKTLREGASIYKEHLTVQWLSESITELRNEMLEVQESTSNVTKALQQQQQYSPVMEEINEMKDEMAKLKLSIKALHHRQERNEAELKQLRDEAVQHGEDVRKFMLKRNGPKALPQTIDYVEPESDHRLRHNRILREQLHELEVAQSQMRRELSELQHHKLNDRFHVVEVEQKRLANANFNLSRQVASLEKLHISMLELLEDVEEIQNKVDKGMPDLKHEISKLEFTAAQQTSELNLLREEGRNNAKSVQAIAMSLSTFPSSAATSGNNNSTTVEKNGDKIKVLEKQLDKLQYDVEKIRLASSLHKDMAHSRINKIEAESKLNSSSATFVRMPKSPSELQLASQLVSELEQVEEAYESIVNKLPHDCSQVDDGGSSSTRNAGLYLIAPGGRQHHPIMTHCDGNWTTIQRRVDGSVDFNRSWNEYAQGFGNPSGEFWIGNEVLHQLTAKHCMRLRIEIQDIYDNYWYAEYGSFSIASRDSGFRIDIGNFEGNASDALDYQNHMEFSAIDVDRDISNTHCAGNYEGGWWFSHCQHANLNGRYNLGLTWFDSTRNEWIAVKSSHMRVMPSKEKCTKFTERSSTTTTTTAAATSSISPTVDTNRLTTRLD